jgi:hypothetical protein
MSLGRSDEAQALEREIATLAARLAEAKVATALWTDANKSLSLSAAQERAKNQGAGRGFLGGLLGSKFRSAMRAGAAASNATIAKQVAEKRARIADGKREAQENTRQIQDELSAAKQQLKSLAASAKASTAQKTNKAKAVNDSLTILKKLKEAKDAGLLTQEEFESKRAKLVGDL